MSDVAGVSEVSDSGAVAPTSEASPQEKPNPLAAYEGVRLTGLNQLKEEFPEIYEKIEIMMYQDSSAQLRRLESGVEEAIKRSKENQG